MYGKQSVFIIVILVLQEHTTVTWTPPH